MNSLQKRFGFGLGCVIFLLGVSACQPAPHSAASAPPVPASWVIGSESEAEGATPPVSAPNLVTDNGEVSDPGDSDAETDAEAPTLADTTKALFATQASSLETLPAPAKTPWKLAAVMTDLSISASGWLGFLVQKGTPSVTTVWRKQYPAKHAPDAVFSETESAADLVVGPETTSVDIERDLEPSVRALVSTGGVRNETNLRRNLLSAAADFQNVTTLLSTVNPKGQWWVSRFRLDFAVDVSGNVTPAVTLGAEAKVRFEWHRLRAKRPTPAAQALARNAFAGRPGLAENLVAFADHLGNDLSEIADGSSVKAKGFRAYGYRVGLGITAKGNVGVAKAVGTLTGHLYFARDVSKPVVHPKPTEGGEMLLVTNENDFGKIDRRAFRKGLRKALRIGRFFARHADQARGKWKIHELRTGFDLSLGGKTGIVTVGGVASTEISFYNENF